MKLTGVTGLKPAPVEWRDHRTPVSLLFGDVYFSVQDGLAESNYVFVEGNRLLERWENLAQSSKRVTFRVGELGFGTGLNFLLLLSLWRKFWARYPHITAVLEYYTCELHPLSRKDLSQALAAWPELATEADWLASEYPPLVSGKHIRWCELSPHAPVRLELHFSEAQQALESWTVQSQIHAWLLDGFAPSKNPEMWRDDLLNLVAQHSAQGATFATFTSAGWVRRGLESRGFVVRKMQGFGKKREMAVGYFQNAEEPKAPSRELNICIVGAGIAGAGTARAFVRRGYRVEVRDQAAEPAAGASGNPVGIVKPHLVGKGGANSEFSVACSSFLQSELKRLLPQDSGACGVVHAFRERESLDKAVRIFSERDYPDDYLESLNVGQVKDITGWSLVADAQIRSQPAAVFFREAGWVKPQQLVRASLAGAHLALGWKLISIEWDTVRSQWKLGWENGSVDYSFADVVILACSNGVEGVQGLNQWVPELEKSPLGKVRGQVFVVQRPEGIAHEGVFSGDGYAIALHDGTFVVGATFDHDDGPEVRPEQNQALWDKLKNQIQLPEQLPPVSLSRVSFRATTPSRLPKWGWVGKGLGVSLGHGSRGMVTGPAVGDLLATQFEAEIQMRS